MRKTISGQLIVIILFITTLAIGAGWVINATFLSRFFSYSRRTDIVKSYILINDFYSKNYQTEENYMEVNEKLQKIIDTMYTKNNITTVILNDSIFNRADFDPVTVDKDNKYLNIVTGLTPDATVSVNGEKFEEKLVEYSYGIYPEGTTIVSEDPTFHLIELKEKIDNNIIDIKSDGTEDMENENFREYIVAWGTVDNGNTYMFRSSVENLSINAQLSNRFYLYVGMCSVILSCLLAYLSGEKFSRPIRKLSEISKAMCKLDFENKYTGKEKNEIGRLGKNINELSSKLEDTISELKSANIELQKDMVEKAKKEARTREFLSDVSHEFKTPIALIQSYTEGLLDGIVEDRESMESYCEIILDESKKMNDMVKQLLELAQMENSVDNLSIERFDIVDIINNILVSVDIIIKQEDITIEFNEVEPIFVWGDVEKIEKVLRNFITNAINHLKYEKIIKISFYKIDNEIEISIFNTGDPIDDEEKERIWEKFYKVDKSRSREYGGNGIGLSIVKAIMERHQKEFGIRNQKDGVEFFIRLDC